MLVDADLERAEVAVKILSDLRWKVREDLAFLSAQDKWKNLHVNFQ